MLKTLANIKKFWYYIEVPTGIWEFSSAGRASALQAGGRRFEPYNSHQLNKLPHWGICGNGSVVERCLAKANVASSNLVSRSTFPAGSNTCRYLYISKTYMAP